jgi:type I restriction-modification system DNA methylase subunit
MEASQISKKIDRPFFTKTSIAIMSSVENFKSAVVRIRDILRNEAITEMDSMRHICLYLLSRFITKEKVKILNVPSQFAWENLIETAQTKNGGVQKAFDYFYNKEEDCLVNHFDRLFEIQNFSFDMKKPHKHKEILEILDKINIEHIDCKIDKLGYVYEQHLSKGGGGRGLGQFFTDRTVCKYMVDMCKPKFKSPGVPESVCDPAMGTGGFLTSYINYFNNNYKDIHIDWNIQQKEIHGYDKDPKPAGLARLNLFIETNGCRSTNLITEDSLYNGLQQTGYDNILANMPFGLTGLKHADCCEAIRQLKIRGTKSEPLFLQLMMVSLNLGGRCAVVVPDGMIENDSSLHNNTRKYLVDNYEVKKIIKMKGQLFMNTPIKPTILFFENNGRPTTKIEFSEIINNENGEITETHTLSINKSQLNNIYSFDMRIYQKNNIKNIIPNKTPMVKLGDVVSFTNGYAFKSKEFISNGIPIIKITTIKNNIIKLEKAEYAKEDKKLTPYIVKKDDIVIALSGATVGIIGINYSGIESYLNQRVAKFNIKSNRLNSKYLYYYMITNNFVKQVRDLAGGSAQPNVSTKKIENINIPLPSIEIQNKIVYELDNLYKKKEEAQKIVDETEYNAKLSFDLYLSS